MFWKIFRIFVTMKRERIATYISFFASILLLLSVIVPHHHHDDGMPCYRWIFELSADSAQGDAVPEEAASHQHDCGCVGHNQALFSSLEHHAVSEQYLIPLLVLFDFINPPELFTSSLIYSRERAFYVESLHDAWVVRAAGLRAPPVMWL